MTTTNIRDVEDAAAFRMSHTGASISVIADKRMPRGAYRFMGDSYECPIVQIEKLGLLAKSPFLSLDKAISMVTGGGQTFFRVFMNTDDVQALVDEGATKPKYNALEPSEDTWRARR